MERAARFGTTRLQQNGGKRVTVEITVDWQTTKFEPEVCVNLREADLGEVDI